MYASVAVLGKERRSSIPRESSTRVIADALAGWILSMKLVSCD